MAMQPVGSSSQRDGTFLVCPGVSRMTAEAWAVRWNSLTMPANMLLRVRATVTLKRWHVEPSLGPRPYPEPLGVKRESLISASETGYSKVMVYGPVPVAGTEFGLLGQPGMNWLQGMLAPEGRPGALFWMYAHASWQALDGLEDSWLEAARAAKSAID